MSSIGISESKICVIKLASTVQIKRQSRALPAMARTRLIQDFSVSSYFAEFVSDVN